MLKPGTGRFLSACLIIPERTIASLTRDRVRLSTLSNSCPGLMTAGRATEPRVVVRTAGQAVGPTGGRATRRGTALAEQTSPRAELYTCKDELGSSGSSILYTQDSICRKWPAERAERAGRTRAEANPSRRRSAAAREQPASRSPVRGRLRVAGLPCGAAPAPRDALRLGTCRRPSW